MDSKVGFSVNYTSTTSEKMQIKLAANPEIFFEYSNSSAKNNAVKTGENYMQCDSKNFVINIPVKAGDVIYVKYSAKGSNAAKLDVYGSEPAITADADAVKESTGKTEGESVIFKATATKGGTAKIKETNGGMRIYAISINQKPTGIQNVKVADAKSANGAIYNLAGQKVNENYKGIVIKNGKKFIQK
jgi:carbohydrate-selective porin OprB